MKESKVGAETHIPRELRVPGAASEMHRGWRQNPQPRAQPLLEAAEQCLPSFPWRRLRQKGGLYLRDLLQNFWWALSGVGLGICILECCQALLMLSAAGGTFGAPLACGFPISIKPSKSKQQCLWNTNLNIHKNSYIPLEVTWGHTAWAGESHPTSRLPSFFW